MKRFVAMVVSLFMISALILPVSASPRDFSPDDPELAKRFTVFLDQLQAHPDYQSYPYHTVFFYGDAGGAILSSKPTVSKDDPVRLLYGAYGYDLVAYAANVYYDTLLVVGAVDHRFVRMRTRAQPTTGTTSVMDIVYIIRNYTNMTLAGEDTLVTDYDWKIDLNPIVDTSRLISLVVQAEALEQSKYTPETWSILFLALSDAKALLESSSKTQAEVDVMCTRMQSAIDGLALIPVLPDTTELRQVLGEAKAIEDIGYTAYSWSRLQTAIVQGDQLLAKSYYTASEVSVATTNLRTGISGLEIYSPVDPGDHRYLVDGIRLIDLFPAQDAIMQNIREGRKFGLFVFAVLLVILVLVRLIKQLLNIDYTRDSRRDDTMLK